MVSLSQVTQGQVNTANKAFGLLKKAMKDRLLVKPAAMNGFKWAELLPLFSKRHLSVVKVRGNPDLKTISSLAARSPLKAGFKMRTLVAWHFLVNAEDPFACSTSTSELCSAGAFLLTIFRYVYGDDLDGFCYYDVCPLTGWALVQDDSSGIQTAKNVISDPVIKDAFQQYAKSVAEAFTPAPIVTLGRAARQCLRPMQVVMELDHPTHLLQQKYLKTFLDKNKAFAASLGATPITPSLDLLKLVPPADPDMVRKVCVLLVFFFVMR
jgi:hypothetical protein